MLRALRGTQAFREYSLASRKEISILGSTRFVRRTCFKEAPRYEHSCHSCIARSEIRERDMSALPPTPLLPSPRRPGAERGLFPPISCSASKYLFLLAGSHNTTMRSTHRMSAQVSLDGVQHSNRED